MCQCLVRSLVGLPCLLQLLLGPTCEFAFFHKNVLDEVIEFAKIHEEELSSQLSMTTEADVLVTTVAYIHFFTALALSLLSVFVF